MTILLPKRASSCLNLSIILLSWFGLITCKKVMGVGVQRQSLGGLAILLVIGHLVGCGVVPTGVKRIGNPSQIYRQSLIRRPMTPVVGSAVRISSDEADAPTPDEEASAPPLAAPGESGLAPLPKPTPTPKFQPKTGAPEPTDADALYQTLKRFGYRRTQAQMVDTIRAVTRQYPVNIPVGSWGWDPAVDSRKHYDWWRQTLKEDTLNYQEYLQQSLLVAQNKFDVVYYVWISKQDDPQKQRSERNYSTFVDLNRELPIVKGIDEGGWLTQISPEGLIVDYLRIPPEFLRDYNHLLKIPEDLYY